MKPGSVGTATSRYQRLHQNFRRQPEPDHLAGFVLAVDDGPSQSDGAVEVALSR
jgi:hypothetical protein